MRFQQVEQEADFQHMEGLKREVQNAYCVSICSAALMLFFLLRADPPNCGDNIRGLIFLAIIIRVGVCNGVYTLMFLLAKCRVLAASTARILITVSWFFLLIWYIHVTKKFYSETNDCRKVSSNIWVAHLLLLIEAFFNMFFM